MTEQDPHRESCRRQHRLIGMFLAVDAWTRGLDCIVLDRNHLEKFLGLKRFKSTRIEWLREDLKPWFPHQDAYYKSGAPSSIHSLFLARVPIAPHLPKGTMTTERRIAGLADTAPRTAPYSSSKFSRRVPSEADIIARLAVLGAGLVDPSDDFLGSKPQSIIYKVTVKK